MSNNKNEKAYKENEKNIGANPCHHIHEEACETEKEFTRRILNSLNEKESSKES